MRTQSTIGRMASLALCVSVIALGWTPVPVKAEDASEFTKAVERYRHRIRKAPEDLKLHRKMIEYAAQTDRLAVPFHIYKAAYEEHPDHPTVLYVLAYTHLIEGSNDALTEAEALLQSAVEKYPEFAEAYIVLGRCYAAQAKIDAAVEAFEKSVELNPKLWEAHFELGNYHRDGRNYQQAIAHYTQSLEQHPKHAQTHFNLGVVYRQIGDLEQAHDAFSQAIEQDNRYADAYYQLGQIYALQGKTKEALKQYREGQKLDADDAKARYQLAHIFLDRDDERHAILSLRSALVADVTYAKYADLLKDVNRPRAIEIIEEILQEHPDNAELQHFAGKLYLKRDQKAEARDHLERAKALNPENADVRFALGQLYEAEAPDAAVQEYKRAAELGKSELDFLLKLAETYRQENDAEKFHDVAQRILAIDPNQPAIHYQLAEFYDAQSYRKKQAGKVEEAERLFNLALEHADKASLLAPTNVQYLLKLATLHDQAGQIKAIRFYDQAIELDPQNAEAYYRRGAFMSNYTFGREKVLLYGPEDVMADLQRAVQLDPKLAGAHYALGVAYDRMGDVTQAMAAFQKAAKLDPSDPRPHLYLGEKYANSGQPHRAITAFAKAIKADPENVEALKDYAFLALAYDEERGWKQAKRALETAMQIRPNDPEILMNYGHTLLLSGENQEAIEHYRRSIELKPDWPLSHYNLAIAYERIGEKVLALAEYEKVIQLDPDGSQAEKARERIHILTESK